MMATDPNIVAAMVRSSGLPIPKPSVGFSEEKNEQKQAKANENLEGHEKGQRKAVRKGAAKGRAEWANDNPRGYSRARERSK